MFNCGSSVSFSLSFSAAASVCLLVIAAVLLLLLFMVEVGSSTVFKRNTLTMTMKLGVTSDGCEVSVVTDFK